MDIEIDYLLSASSEHESYPASNLVNGKKWTVSKKGISEAVVDLKFKRASIIHSISVGNWESAFVKIEVGSSSVGDEWYSFLPTTRFMDQSESRNGLNTARVKLFSETDFHSENSKKTWDKARVTCQQFFSNQRTIGLSFIKFGCGKSQSSHKHEINDKIAEKEKQLLKKLKQATSKKDVYNSNEYSIKANALDVQKALESQKKQREEKHRRDEEIKLKNQFVSSDFLSKTNGTKQKPAPKAEDNRSLKHRIDHCSVNNPLNYNTLNNDSSTSDVAGKSKENSTRKESEFSKRKRTLEQEKMNVKRQKLDEAKMEAEIDRKNDQILKAECSKDNKTTANKCTSRSTESVPFKKILENVRIALSGFVNPERSRIRDQALEMGAKCDRDLTPMTTHLICAFENTPKAKKFDYGIIVKKSWIHLQHATKKRIDWKKHTWTKPDSDESDEDLYFKNGTKSNTEKPSTEETDLVKTSKPDEIDTDDEINDALGEIEADKGESLKSNNVIDEPTERIIRSSDTLDNSSAEAKSHKCVDRNKYEFSYEQNQDYCLSDYSDENFQEKIHLFAPYIFVVGDDVDESISKLILKNGGCIDDVIDQTTTHVIEIERKMKKKKDIIYTKPGWITDSLRMKKLLNPNIPRYSHQ